MEGGHMKITTLMWHLKDYKPEWLICHASCCQILSFQPYESNLSVISDMLYVTDNINLLPYRGREPISILLLSPNITVDSKDLLIRKSINCNILTIEYQDTRESLFSLLSSWFFRETKYLNDINSLFVSSNEHKGLQYLVDVAYKITKSPIIIFDTCHKILAVHHPNASDAAWLDIDIQKDMGYLSETALKYLKHKDIYEKLRTNPSVLYTKEKKDEYGWLNTLVYIHGIEAALIGMAETDHEFTPYDYDFLDIFKQLISSEMQKGDFYSDNHTIVHSAFLLDLLDGKFPTNDVINIRRKYLGLSDAKFYYILTIFDTITNISKKRIQIIAYQVQNLLPASYWCIYKGKPVFLIMQNTVNADFYLEQSRLREILNANHLTGALSNPFNNLLEILKYYKQTTTVFRLCKQLGEHHTIYLYSDYMFCHIGQLLSESYELKDFYHPAILQIKQYDIEHQSNFLETLKEALVHVNNPTLCSKNLFIHKNTFFYRMNKIRELFDLNLEDGTERLKLHLTLELMKADPKDI
jgi:hypothetical protein